MVITSMWCFTVITVELKALPDVTVMIISHREGLEESAEMGSKTSPSLQIGSEMVSTLQGESISMELQASGWPC